MISTPSRSYCVFMSVVVFTVLSRLGPMSNLGPSRPGIVSPISADNFLTLVDSTLETFTVSFSVAAMVYAANLKLIGCTKVLVHTIRSLGCHSAPFVTEATSTRSNKKGSFSPGSSSSDRAFRRSSHGWESLRGNLPKILNCPCLTVVPQIAKRWARVRWPVIGYRINRHMRNRPIGIGIGHNGTVRVLSFGHCRLRCQMIERAGLALSLVFVVDILFERFRLKNSPAPLPALRLVATGVPDRQPDAEPYHYSRPGNAKNGPSAYWRFEGARSPVP